MYLLLFLYSDGIMPVHFWKARRNVLIEWNPERSAISCILAFGSASIKRLLSSIRNWLT